MSDTENNKQSSSEENKSILGLSMSELAGLSADDLNNNPTAIKMLLHYYHQLVDENTALKNDKNTLKTYLDAYTNYKSNAATGAILLTLSNISIGFSVNLICNGHTWPGVSSLIIGIAMVIVGIYFTFVKEKR